MPIEITNLHDIEELPVYAQPLKMISTQEAVHVLLNSELSERKFRHGMAISSVW